MKIHIAYRLLILVLVMACCAGPAAAQGIEIAWSPASNISNTPTSSNRPTIVADAAGCLHVVWGEDIGGKSVLGIPNGITGQANTLLYTRWDGSTWSEPTDIIFVPGEGLAEYPSLAIGSDQALHLVWTGMSRIYYSRALARDAGSPHAWLPPIVVGGSARTSWESAVAVDDQNTVHILYASGGADAAVSHVRIAEGGLGEMTATELSTFLLPPDEVAFLNLSLKIDPKGRLHALWGVVREEGVGHAIYYARSLDGGQTWSDTVQLARGRISQDQAEYAKAEYPALGIAGDSELHLIYVYPNNMARQERISLDAGETWGEPHTIYPDLEGINGANVPFTDRMGNLHVISNMRTHQQVGGLIYWRWLGDHWSPWQFANLETTGKPTGRGGHFPVVTIRLGNEIHALWNTNFSDEAGEVWHVSGVIPDVPAQTPAPTPTTKGPTPQVQPRQSPGAPVVEESSAVSGQFGPAGAVTPTGERSVLASSTPLGILVGMAPALLLVLGVMTWHLWRRR